mmetsp:Transcript_12694/g.42675  ORF Transcript_12694/g.42675 Transcript_12694/m.42675 type:complete len:272 (+) Transcript_12694:48-863(+)
MAICVQNTHSLDTASTRLARVERDRESVSPLTARSPQTLDIAATRPGTHSYTYSGPYPRTSKPPLVSRMSRHTAPWSNPPPPSPEGALRKSKLVCCGGGGCWARRCSAAAAWRCRAAAVRADRLGSGAAAAPSAVGGAGAAAAVPNEELRRGVVSGIMLTQTAPPVPVDIARERSRPRRGVVGFALASEEERATCVATWCAVVRAPSRPRSVRSDFVRGGRYSSPRRIVDEETATAARRSSVCVKTVRTTCCCRAERRRRLHPCRRANSTR